MTGRTGVVLTDLIYSNKTSQWNLGQYDFLLPLSGRDVKTTLNSKKFNRNRIKTVAIVLLIVSIFFGVYEAYAGTIAFNEIRALVSYFEQAPVVHLDQNAGQSHFGYYYLFPWSGSYLNAKQSAINTLYMMGIGYVISLFGNFLGQEFGVYLTASQVVAFIAGILYSAYDGASSINAVLVGAEWAGTDLCLSSLMILLNGVVVPIVLPLLVTFGSL